MTFQYKSKAHFLYAASHNELQSMGVKITSGSDFEEYRELLAIARPDHALGEPFEPTKYELTERNAIWMVGHNEAGEIIHTDIPQVACLLTLRSPDARSLAMKYDSGHAPGKHISTRRKRPVFAPGRAATHAPGVIGQRQAP